MILDDILERVWASLAGSVSPDHGAFSTLELATVALDGSPRVRTIVLRAVDDHVRAIGFHTDGRSEKVAEIKRDPRVALVGYDRHERRQFRLTGVARIEKDEAQRRRVWDACSASTLRLYRAPVASGTVIGRPRDAQPSPGVGQEGAGSSGSDSHGADAEKDPTDAPRREGFDHFCLVAVSVSAIDYLDLSNEGHIRAKFEWCEGRWRGSWIAP